MVSAPFDPTQWSTDGLVALIIEARARAAKESDDVMVTHYRLRLESARAELAKRNTAEILRRAELESS